MRVELPFDERLISANVDLPDDQILFAVSKDPPPTAEWESIVLEALANPIGAPRLKDHDLLGKKVVVITDDWGRPTPSWRVLPAILAEVEAAGARREDITVMTGSGVHQPMSDEDMIRKVGQEVKDAYRCVSHDAVEHEMTFIGQSSRGTPVWVSKIVADADFRIAVGRVGPHPTHGYEGGSKMITPAVSHWITVLRNHSTNFSPYAEYGSILNNPSRLDVDEIGGMVGLEFIVNFVINRRGECFAGFAGHRLIAHRSAIAWGDREVWGAEIGKRADIVIAAPGDRSRQTMAASALDMAILACRPGGTTILVNGEGPAANPLTPRPPFGNGSTPKTLAEQMASWSFDQIFQEHERRDNELEPRKVSDRCKTIRGEYYRRRPGMTRNVIIVGEPLAPDGEWRSGQHLAETLQEAVDQAIAREGRSASVVIVPHASTTLPLERFHTANDALEVGGEQLTSQLMSQRSGV
jgi:nickel-dependent lactate racemase